MSKCPHCPEHKKSVDDISAIHAKISKFLAE